MILPAPGWLVPAPTVPQEPPVQQEQPAERQQRELEGGLLVKYDSWSYDGETGQLVFEGNVEAFYEQTKLIASKLSLNEQTKVGTAEGGVRLEDPEGSITAGLIE